MNHMLRTYTKNMDCLLLLSLPTGRSNKAQWLVAQLLPPLVSLHHEEHTHIYGYVCTAHHAPQPPNSC